MNLRKILDTTDISNWDVDQVRDYFAIFSGATMMNATPHYKPVRFR